MSVWHKLQLSEITEWASGGTPSKDNPRYWNGGIPWISASSMRGRIFNSSTRTLTSEGVSNGSKLAPRGSVLLLVRGSMLFNTIPVGFAGEGVAFNQDVKAITGKRIDSGYLYYFLKASEHALLSSVVGTGIGAGKLDTDQLRSMKIFLPPRLEQEKIASFLAAIDAKITFLDNRITLLQRYKRGVVQQIFSQQVRFKDESNRTYPNWGLKKLGQVFYEIKNKVGGSNVETYSITASVGFVSQQSKFGKDISGNQNKNYILLEKNDFSYNKGNSKTFAYGCVFVNKEGKQIAVPSVFISFSLHDKAMSTEFFAQLFASHYLDKLLRGIISSGARMDGLLNVSKVDFFDINIPVPHSDEQQKIATLLDDLDKKIAIEQGRLSAAKEWKKGLFQKMFV